MPIKLPAFGTFSKVLNGAGVETGSARGFWGGVTKDDDIVVTIWIDEAEGEDRFPIWKPRTRHGRLLDMWELGRITPGATVRVIMLRAKSKRGPDGPSSIHSAGLMDGQWKVTEVDQARGRAFIAPA